MSKTLSVTSSLLVLALAACGESPVTQPEVPGPHLMQGSGAGAVFLTNPFIGVLFTDAAGNSCLALVSPPTDDINDFLRVDPTGVVAAHVTDSPASITVTTAGGQVFSGSGTLTFNINNIAALTAFTATAAGRVSNGSVTKTAVCAGATDGQGIVRLPDLIQLN